MLLTSPLVYRLHNCEKQHRTVTTFLRCAIRHVRVFSEGEYARIAWCQYPTVHAFGSLDAAEESLRAVNVPGCGVRCTGDHSIVRVDLELQEARRHAS